MRYRLQTLQPIRKAVPMYRKITGIVPLTFLGFSIHWSVRSIYQSIHWSVNPLINPFISQFNNHQVLQLINQANKQNQSIYLSSHSMNNPERNSFWQQSILQSSSCVNFSTYQWLLNQSIYMNLFLYLSINFSINQSQFLF